MPVMDILSISVEMECCTWHFLVYKAGFGVVVVFIKTRSKLKRNFGHFGAR